MGMARLKHLSEYILLRGGQSLLLVLPHRGALITAWVLAWLSFHLARVGRDEAVRRIIEVLGTSMTHREATRIAWLSWRNTCFNVAEMMRVTRLSPAWMRAHTHGMDDAIASLRTLIDAHGGAVIAVSHMGNWDLAGVACKQAAIDIFSIAGKQKNPYVNRWLDRIRGHSMDVLERGSSALRVVLRRLRRRGAFAILPDVRMPTPDLDIAFLGGRANLGRGMAQFARMAKVPIVPVLLTRVGWTHHAVVCHAPVFADREERSEADLVRMTQTVMDHFDTAIRQQPEQWFWYNRRWVLRPLKPKPPKPPVNRD